MARTHHATSRPSTRRSPRRWSATRPSCIMGEDIAGGMRRAGRGRRLGRRARRHQGPLPQVPRPRDRHPDLRVGLRRRGRRRRGLRAAPGGRAHVRRLHGRVLRPDLQPGGEVPLHVRRQGRDADGHPHDVGRRASARPRSTRRRCYPMFTHIPGLKVVVPSTPYDAKGLLIAGHPRRRPGHLLRAQGALRHRGRRARGAVRDPVRRGQHRARGRRRDGRRARAHGRCWPSRPPTELEGEGISCEVVDPRTTSPLDHDTILESVENTGRLVVVDEANPRCGIAADIVAQVAAGGLRRAQGGAADGDAAAHARCRSAPCSRTPTCPTPEQIAAAVREVAGASARAADERRDPEARACPSGACR